jgi:hypothetical protein
VVKGKKKEVIQYCFLFKIRKENWVLQMVEGLGRRFRFTFMEGYGKGKYNAQKPYFVLVFDCFFSLFLFYSKLETGNKLN